MLVRTADPGAPGQLDSTRKRLAYDRLPGNTSPMEWLLLFLLAVLPGAVGFLYYYRKDELRREPLVVLGKAFLIGAVLVFPAGFLEHLLSPEDPETLADSFREAFFLISPVEEAFRLLAIWYVALRSQHFDEVVDGVVYGAVAAAGFATLENIFYVMEHGYAVGFLRAVVSVPMHIFCGVLIGHGVARWKISGSRWPLAVLFLLAWLAHGAFDAPLLGGEEQGWLLFWPVIVVVLLAFLSGLLLKRALLADGLAMSELFRDQESWVGRLFQVALAVLFFLIAVGGMLLLSGAGLMYSEGEGEWQWALGAGIFLLFAGVLPLLWGRLQKRLL